MRMCELLSPAGDMECLIAAIKGGCDAVYVGASKFGARSFAKNFTRSEMIDAIKMCHLYGVKIYVTMNTLVKDSEVDEFVNLVSFLHENDVDAIIMQDFGMICLIRDMFPNLEIHASTQCNNNYKETVKLLKDIGVSRIVVPRELSIDEIEKIDVDIEIEAFIHGALCISYSGLCLMSSLLGHRSGNRGECTGCCRLFYDLIYKNNIVKSGYLLSTKELNTSKHINDLLNSNIYSFKIEGRMKSSQYVYFITKYYRNLIDNNLNIDKNMDILKVLYNRKFTCGRIFSSNDNDIMNINSVNHQGLLVGRVLSFNDDKIKLYIDREIHQEDGIRFNNSNKGMIVNFLYDSKMKLTSKCHGVCYVDNKVSLNENDVVSITSSKVLNNYIDNLPDRKVSLSVSFIGHILEPAVLIVSDGKNEVKVTGEVISSARSCSVSSDRIIKQASKMGNSIYEVKDFDIDIDEDIFISMGSINKMRREALELLSQKRLSKRSKYLKVSKEFKKLDVISTNLCAVNIYNSDEVSKYSKYDIYFLHDISMFLKYKNKNNIYYSVDCNNVKDRFEREIVSNYLYPLDNSIADYSFNVFNCYTVYYLHKLGYKGVFVSVELSDVEIYNLIDNFYKKFKFYPNLFVYVFGRVRVMNILGNILNIKNNEVYYLKNKNNMFPVVYDGKFTNVYSSFVMDRINLGKSLHYNINKCFDFSMVSDEEISKFNIIN